MKSLEPLNEVLLEILTERVRQDKKWGVQNHRDGTGYAGSKEDADDARSQCDARFEMGQGTWKDILKEEVFEAFAEMNPAKLEEELIQVAAVATAWVEAIRRRKR